MRWEDERERGCRSKVRYTTRLEAEEQAAFHHTYESGSTLRVYHCTFCRGYHLTSQPAHNEHEGAPC